jgi:hypothetical protein
MAAVPSPVRVLGVSLLVAFAVGGVLGLAYALLAGRVIAHGLGAGWFTVGLMCLAIGLLGAVEPPEGWRGRGERRSVAFKLGADTTGTEGPSTFEMLLWGAVVGGILIAISIGAFYIAAQ